MKPGFANQESRNAGMPMAAVELTKLPQFVAKLKEAGMQKIIDEKQRQLDEWAKTKKN